MNSTLNVFLMQEMKYDFILAQNKISKKKNAGDGNSMTNGLLSHGAKFQSAPLQESSLSV